MLRSLDGTPVLVLLLLLIPISLIDALSTNALLAYNNLCFGPDGVDPKNICPFSYADYYPVVAQISGNTLLPSNVPRIVANSGRFCASAGSISMGCLPGFFTNIASNLTTDEKELTQLLVQASMYCAEKYPVGALQVSSQFTECINNQTENFLPELMGVPSCPGYFSPPLITCMIKCDPGSYCFGMGVLNDGTGLCDPYGVTPISLLGQTVCQGQFWMKPCPDGFYCPTPKEGYICPEGYYCRDGCQVPEHCPSTARCGAGTAVPFDAVPFITSGLVAIIIFILVRVAWLIRQRRTRFEEAAAKCKAQQKLNEKEALKRAHTSRIMSLKIINERVLFKQVPFRMTIRFENLSLKLRNKAGTTVLHGVSGVCGAGQITAVMGPSGAGKTSFLAALTGKAQAYAKIRGSVFINGTFSKLKQYRDIIGFVPQEDIMNRELTVREVLYFSAFYRLPATTTNKERDDKVDRLLNVLDLWTIRNHVIGDEKKRGISGGQRKRVNIGIELIAEPALLLLDEPTSGLDATSSRVVMETLQLISQTGVNIIVVLHQPRYEIVEMFNELLLLGKGGRTVYMGPTSGALPYFESLGFRLPPLVNPADFYMDAIAGITPPVHPLPPLSPGGAATYASEVAIARLEAENLGISDGDGSRFGRAVGTARRIWAAAAPPPSLPPSLSLHVAIIYHRLSSPVDWLLSFVVIFIFVVIVVVVFIAVAVAAAAPAFNVFTASAP